MFKILITDKLSDLGMEVFRKEKDIQADEQFNKTPAELKAILPEGVGREGQQ